MTDIEVEGRGGQVAFDGQFVTISRKGFLARTTHGKGDKRIPVRSITAVQWKPAGAMVNGYIQFTVPGGNEVRSRAGRQTNDAAHDENSILFTKQQQPAFEKLRAAIEESIATGGAPAASPDNTTDRLNQLAELHRSGVLTDEEFAAAKAKALGL